MLTLLRNLVNHVNYLILRMAMNKRPFPHPKALVDMKKSLMYIDDAAKVVLELLDENEL